jgi:hypothetical protein
VLLAINSASVYDFMLDWTNTGETYTEHKRAVEADMTYIRTKETLCKRQKLNGTEETEKQLGIV